MRTPRTRRLGPRLLAVLGTVALAAAGAVLTAGAPPASAAATAGCGKTPTLHSGPYTIQSSGQNRSFVLRIPDGYSNTRGNTASVSNSGIPATLRRQ